MSLRLVLLSHIFVLSSVTYASQYKLDLSVLKKAAQISYGVSCSMEANEAIVCSHPSYKQHKFQLELFAKKEILLTIIGDPATAFNFRCEKNLCGSSLLVSLMEYVKMQLLDKGNCDNFEVHNQDQAGRFYMVSSCKDSRGSMVRMKVFAQENVVWNEAQGFKSLGTYITKIQLN